MRHIRIQGNAVKARMRGDDPTTQPDMRMLDLFAGRGGWTNAFLARGWDCVGVDIVQSPDYRGEFMEADVMTLDADFVRRFDFVCASSPCEEFSLFGMKHFFPDPPHPERGITLFCHTRKICQYAEVPYVMENVRAAQQFVGHARHHCGSFYLWGNGVPALLHQGIKKGLNMGRDPLTGKRLLHLGRRSSHGSKKRAADKAITATIPPELANCVAEYAERLIGMHGEVWRQLVTQSNEGVDQ